MEKDYYQSQNEPAYSIFECKVQLMRDFPDIYADVIKKVIEMHNGHYAKSHRSLCIMRAKLKKGPRDDVVRVELQNDYGHSKTFFVHNKTRLRDCQRCHTPELLRPEVEFVRKRNLPISSVEGASVNEAGSSHDSTEGSQAITCNCCFSSCVFESMTQCEEGHLVCVDCFNSYIREKLFGSGKIQLDCLTSECTSVYPNSELQRCLDAKVWSKYEEIFMEENLNKAGVAKDLIRCPSCNFAALLSPSTKMFRCRKEDCQKASCRDCGVDWNCHNGLDCADIKNREDSLRLEYEEKMTKAKVRTCESCRAQFTKEDGCNMITCRCDTKMCYICRTSKITYEHFCRHPRKPGNGCTLCTSCSLWTNPQEDEKRAIREMKNEAMGKRKELGYNGIKDIGVPNEQLTPQKVNKSVAPPTLNGQHPHPIGHQP